MDSISSKNSKVYIVIVVYQMVQQLDLTMFLELFLRMIRERSKTHSRFGHYFYSNLYECAPRGPRGVKTQIFFTKKTVEPLH